MKHAIISDVHANPQALERVLADAERYGMFGATRDHEPQPCMSIACGDVRHLRSGGLETSSFALCATEDKSSRPPLRIHRALVGSTCPPDTNAAFAAHEITRKSNR